MDLKNKNKIPELFQNSNDQIDENEVKAKSKRKRVAGQQKTTKSKKLVENLEPPTASEVKNKRINRMLRKINENDVIINSKQKPREFTSTPTGMRRKTLKVPNNVSIINNDLENQ